MLLYSGEHIMFEKALTACVAITFICCICSAEDALKFSSREAREAQTNYANELKKLDAAYEAKKAELTIKLVADLELAQEVATKAGKLDDAIQIREAIALRKADSKPKATPSRLSDEEKLKRALAGTLWQSTKPKSSLGNMVFEFCPDHTIKASWHEDPSLWTATGARQVSAIMTHSRFISHLKFDADLKSLIDAEDVVWKRIK
jgi:hypothetical protein